MPKPPIELLSPQNAKIKQTRQLHANRKARQESGLFVLEGARLVQDARQNKADFAWVLVTPAFAEANAPLVEDLITHFPLAFVAPQVLASCADTEQPQGILAVAMQPKLALPAQLTFSLILDELRDPGNVGTILRTAAAAGVECVFCSSASVDVYNPKVVRAAMGAHWRVPLRVLPWQELQQQFSARQSPTQVWLADAHGEAQYNVVDWQQPSAILVSNEAHGASQLAQCLPHRSVRIPMADSSESLNVSVACGVLLVEAARQRALVKTI